MVSSYMTPTSMEQRVRRAGYGRLWDEFGLGARGIRALRIPLFLPQPSVLTPESCQPLGLHVHYRLTPAQHREVLWAMFGEDNGAALPA